MPRTPLHTRPVDPDTPPLVSVLVTCHEQARWLPVCLAAILGQRVDFPVEVRVLDDASTDGTAALLDRMVREPPGVLVARSLPENHRSRGLPVLRTLVEEERGEFIAMCDGDDVWTDPDKLSKQVASLRARPDCVAAFHDVVAVDETAERSLGSVLPAAQRRDLDAGTLRTGEAVLMLGTVMFRRAAGPLPEEFDRAPNRDQFLPVLLGRHGAARFDPEVGPLAYRRHGGGAVDRGGPRGALRDGAAHPGAARRLAPAHRGSRDRSGARGRPPQEGPGTLAGRPGRLSTARARACRVASWAAGQGSAADTTR
jgi:hypothetical protein